MSRPIDQALAEDRPAKATIRNKWAEEVQKYQDNGDVPLYLTLPGAAGKDIQRLIDSGILQVTETGAIQESEQYKVVAIEANSEAVLALQRRFPGLKIRESRLEDMIQGHSPYAWPARDSKVEFCARVVNLDSDRSLRADVARDDVTFPLISIIRKISQLHHEPPVGARQDWSLCVTINSTMNWPPEALRYFFDFLGQNCRQHADFKTSLGDVVGAPFAQQLSDSPETIDHTTLSTEIRRSLVCVFLPKLIVARINDLQWRVSDCLSLSYGDEQAQAPMTTLIMSLTHDDGNTPGQRYEQNLAALMRGLGHIDPSGDIVMAV